MMQLGFRKIGSSRYIKIISSMIIFSWMTLAILVATPAYSLPLPKILIEEFRLAEEAEVITVNNLKDMIPKDARHLIIELYVAANGLESNSTSVQLSFNNGEAGSYINRHLVGEGRNLKTNLDINTESSELLRLPVSVAPKFGGSSAFIPWAFLNNQSKHVLSKSGVGGSYVATGMSHWNSLSSIESISLKLDGSYRFSPGSLIQLYVVDEKSRVSDNILEEHNAGVDFNNIPQDKNELIVIGQTRSSQVNPLRRGDRVWYSANGDKNNKNYQVQRLTGEAPVYSLLNLGTDKLLLDQINEPRVGWNSAAEAPQGVFGPWLLYFPEYRNNNFYRSFISMHGTNDSHYDPIGNELGLWRSESALSKLSFYPQASNTFKKGSKIGLYSTKDPEVRYVVGDNGRREVKLNVPDGFDSAEFYVNARSLSVGSSDGLVFEINNNDRQDSYVTQSAWALDGGGGAVSEHGNEVGVLPSRSDSSKVYSTISGSIRGMSGDYETSIYSIGGVSGEGKLIHSAMSSLEVEQVRSITFRTKNGADFSPGSVFALRLEDSYERRFDVDDLMKPFSINAVSIGVGVSAVAALFVMAFKRSHRSK